jgi:hypothetical protein
MRRSSYSGPRSAAAATALCSSTLLAAGVMAAESTQAGGTTRAENTPAVQENEADPFGDAVPGLRHVGLMFDLGTLSGGMLSVVYRPSPWLRMYGGAGTNGAAPGLRVGAALLPFRRGFGLSLDGGHFFPGDVNGIFATFAGANYDDSHLLEHFDYNFVQLQAGWEVERADLVFFLRGGVGLVWSKLPADGLNRVRNLSSLVDEDGSVEAFLPSIQLGFIGFL